jgi:hypothetical protein
LADLNGQFWLKGRSHKTFDIIIPKKSLFLQFGFGGWAGVFQPSSSPPFGAPL